jgi:hypothetical protein
MVLEVQSCGILRFGVFEADLRSGELRKQGVRIKLQDQSFQVLRLLLQRSGELVTYPKEKSIHRFMDEVRQRTKRTTPLQTKELIEELNPLLRGWGEYYKRAHVRRLFHRLDAWIRRRIWSHRYKRWRNAGWLQLPAPKLYGEYGLVRLLDLIPSLSSRRR